MKTDTFKQHNNLNARTNVPLMKTAKNTSTGGHVAVQLRTDRNDKVMEWKRRHGTHPSRWLQRQTGVTAQKWCYTGSIKTINMGKNQDETGKLDYFYFSIPASKNPGQFQLKGTFMAVGKFWWEQTRRTSASRKENVPPQFITQVSGSWTSSGTKILDMSLSFNKRSVTAPCYITRKTTIPLLQTEMHHTCVSQVNQLYVFYLLFGSPPPVQWAQLKLLPFFKCYLCCCPLDVGFGYRVLFTSRK